MKILSDKMIVLLSVVIFFLNAKMFGQSILIEGVKSHYSLNDIIEFKVINTSNKEVKYNVILEQKGENDEWLEIKADVFSKINGKTQIIYTIKRETTVQRVVDIKDISRNYKDCYKRFRLQYGEDVDKRDSSSFSSIFVFKDK